MGLWGYQTLLFVTFISLLIPFQTSYSYEYNDYLNPQEYLTRCFQAIGNIRLSFLDPRRAGVGTLNQAIAICERLIEAPKLNSSGVIYSSDPIISTSEAREVVRRVDQFHRTYFKSDKYETVMEDSGKGRMVYDTSQPAAYFTYAMFHQTPDYKKAVTLDTSLQLIRSNVPTNRYGSIQHLVNQGAFVEAYDFTNNGPGSNTSPVFGKVILSNDRGLLNGIRSISTPSAFGLSSPSTYGFEPINRDQTLGGGFMGSPSFILLNIGMDEYKTITGSMTLPRRIGKTIMEVAYCSLGPYIKQNQIPQSDIPSTTHPQFNNAPPFRTSNTCMACHSTQDPMVFGYRNITYNLMRQSDFNTTGENINYTRCTNWSSPCNSTTNPRANLAMLQRVKSSSMIQPNSVASPSLIWPVQSNGETDFFKSKNYKGRLSYTSAFSGNLISNEYESLNGSFVGKRQLENLGQLIAASNDYYLCGAMKYSEMLLGIKIERITDSLPNLQGNASSIQINLWNSLKNIISSSDAGIAFNATNSNPKKLLKTLIKLPEFKSRSFGTKAPIQSIAVSGIYPSQGATNQATIVAISGSNFGTGTAVYLGNSQCINVSVLNTHELTCTIPANESNNTGVVSLYVTRNGYTDVKADAFTFTLPQPTQTYTWNSGIKNHFNQYCISCHDSAGSGGYNMMTSTGTGADYNLVKTRITGYLNTNTHSVYYKVNNNSMPADLSTLNLGSTSTVPSQNHWNGVAKSEILQWINSGANEN